MQLKKYGIKDLSDYIIKEKIKNLKIRYLDI